MPNKFVNFIELAPNSKTKVVKVVSANSGILLGIIKWFPHWRAYTFQPYESTVFDVNCLKEILNFIEQQNKLHKSNLAVQKGKTRIQST